MGCRTGFYLVVWDERPVVDVEKALKNALTKVLDQAQVPAAIAKACGNYKDHSLFTAQEYARQVLDQGISLDPFEREF